MAVICCKEGVPLFDTQAMMHNMELALGRELPNATKTKVEEELPSELVAKQDIVCARICAGEGCQAKALGSGPVSVFIAKEVLTDLLLKVLSEPRPLDTTDDVSSPTAFVQ